MVISEFWILKYVQFAGMYGCDSVITLLVNGFDNIFWFSLSLCLSLFVWCVCVFVCVCLNKLSSMDGVPLKMPQSLSQEVKEDIKVIVPDYLTILQETEVSTNTLYRQRP